MSMRMSPNAQEKARLAEAAKADSIRNANQLKSLPKKQPRPLLKPPKMISSQQRARTQQGENIKMGIYSPGAPLNKAARKEMDSKRRQLQLAKHEKTMGRAR